ncbi:hypothetical protein NBRC110019_07690 [Neptunitalea chrysea]|uniref:Uncharacterized protein n=1 Tax=Neptunitalea chrysea TaxID=1647581 RepID=A0A9W6B3K0_9FLAO|nr:hypothetical protein [Neptunitalea chrysea]GLB51730.1 hypothetical protein NBRC110019_07690 [Neptunitalea chrysea]
MKQPLTTYRATGLANGLVFLFKYDLNGILRAFQIEEGEMSDKQMFWLYSENFPAKESLMREKWMKLPNYKKVFKVDRSPADISFDAFWNLYDKKVKKEHSQKAWNKLSEENKIKCFMQLPHYDAYLQRSREAKAHLVTWLNQKRYNDEY